MAASNPHASAIRALSSELKSLNDEPLEGFRVGLANEDNAFDWDIAIFGAPGTLYEGGYFKVINGLLIALLIQSLEKYANILCKFFES